jgi:EmrB/QacA subfamily drug resistance transporter
MSTRAQRIQERAFERRWLILVLLCLSLMLTVLDVSIVNVALPTIQTDLGATSSDLQWIVDAYTLVFAGLLLTAGSLGDRFGRRGALQLGFAIFGVGSIVAALSNSTGVLIGARAVMGVGGALIMPATLSIITNVFPVQERSRAIGVWAASGGLGAVLGPLAGGFLVEHFTWSSVFLVNLPIVLAGVVAGFVLIPTSKDPDAPKLDPIGAVLSIVSLSVTLYAFIEAPDLGWGSATTLIRLAVGVVLLAVFIGWELHVDHPMLEVQLFRKARFSAAAGAITLVYFALVGSVFLQTQYFQFVLGWSPLETGVRMVPSAIALMITSPLSSRVVRMIGTKLTVAIGLGLVTVGLVAMSGMQMDMSYVDIVWRIMLPAAGLGLILAPATESVMGALPIFKAGIGSAVNDTTRQMGGALGVAVIGSVMATVYRSRFDPFFESNLAGIGGLDAARTSIGAADEIARHLPAGLQDLSTAVLASSRSAFIDGLHVALLVAAAASASGVLLALLFLPATARAEDLLEQDREFAAEHAGEFTLPSPVDLGAPHDPEFGISHPTGE